MAHKRFDQGVPAVVGPTKVGLNNHMLAPAAGRGQLISLYFIMCYLGFTVPVIGVGISSDHFGIFRSVLGFSIGLTVLSVFSFAALRRGGVATSRGKGVDRYRLHQRATHAGHASA